MQRATKLEEFTRVDAWDGRPGEIQEIPLEINEEGINEGVTS